MDCIVCAAGTLAATHGRDSVLMHRLSASLQDSQHIQTPPQDAPWQAAHGARHLLPSL